MLYLIPTPIGNLKDITLRALDLLKEVDIILAEDTRVSAKLLNHYGIKTPTRSYHAHNEHKKTAEIIELLKEETQIALITDAGSPAISDPGFLLVRACLEQQIPVVPLPGPTALIPALAGSGLPSDKFHFEGFIPAKKGRNKRFLYLKDYPHTIVIYESPYRLIKTLKDLNELFGNSRKICVAKEISKIHETFHTAFAEELINHFEKLDKIKGEYVLIVGPEQKSN